MTRYMRQLGIVPDSSLATALRYGIRVDTGGFTRNTTTEDLEAAAYLSPLVDVGLLKQIENLPMSTETIDIIGNAIQKPRSKRLISDLLCGIHNGSGCTTTGGRINDTHGGYLYCTSLWH